MKNLKDKLLSYSKIIFRVSVFVLAAVALYFILPSEPRFKYEYQKGAPWKHENLVAPFDFAILKTQTEIDAERRELLKSFTPYFIKDTSIVIQKTAELVNDLSTISEDDYPAKAELVAELTQYLALLYTSGILPSSPESMEILKDRTEISVVSGNLVAKSPISGLLSEKVAFNLFRDQINLLGRRYQGLYAVLLNLDPGKYIHSHLRYDENY